MEQIIHSSTICNPIHSSSSTINTQHNHHNSTIPLQPSTPNQSIQSSIHSQSLNHLLTNSKSFNHNTSLNFSNTFPTITTHLSTFPTRFLFFIKTFNHYFITIYYLINLFFYIVYNFYFSTCFQPQAKLVPHNHPLPQSALFLRCLLFSLAMRVDVFLVYASNHQTQCVVCLCCTPCVRHHTHHCASCSSSPQDRCLVC